MKIESTNYPTWFRVVMAVPQLYIGFIKSKGIWALLVIALLFGLTTWAASALLGSTIVWAVAIGAGVATLGLALFLWCVLLLAVLGR